MPPFPSSQKGFRGKDAGSQGRAVWARRSEPLTAVSSPVQWAFQGKGGLATAPVFREERDSKGKETAGCVPFGRNTSVFENPLLARKIYRVGLPLLQIQFAHTGAPIKHQHAIGLDPLQLHPLPR